MYRAQKSKHLFLIVFFQFCTFLALTGCDSENTTTDSKPTIASPPAVETAAEQQIQPIQPIQLIEPIQAPIQQIQPITTIAPDIENKSYLFVVNDHTIDEFEALLNRAEQVSQAQPDDFDDLEIVMVIHGPGIDFFTNQNHAENSKLLDVAKRLDEFDVIDMKVCETTMSMRGVERQDIPAFIESVPYAPTEIKTRLEQGYINL